MNTRTLSLSLATLLLTAACAAQPTTQPSFPDTVDLPSLERPRILPKANQYLTEPPITLTAYPIHPGGGSTTLAGPHDFYSEADYSWPDPKNPHAPYLNRDGYSYPGAFFDHRRAMWRFDTLVPTLTAAYLLTNDSKYAAAARTHLTAWFITPATRMNPSLTYAQAIPNKNPSTQYGIIDTLHLVEVARSVVLLRQHHQLPADEDAAITHWFADYLHWLRTSTMGIAESNGHNNHSTAYWLQVTAFAQVTQNTALLDEARSRFKTQLLPHMAPDGSFPAELHRTKPYGYSLFELDLMVMLAHLLSTPQDNLFTFTLPNGTSLQTALAYMYPYVKDKSTWPLPPDVNVFDLWPVRSPAFLYGGLAYHNPAYLTLWQSLNPSPTDQEILRNLPIRQPLLWQ
jgi:Alginate lyase